MAAPSIPALAVPPPFRDNPFTRSVAGMVGMGFLGLILLACVGTLPWTLAQGGPPWGLPPKAQTTPDQTAASTARYNAGDANAGRLSPSWWPKSADEIERLNPLVDPATVASIAAAHGVTPAEVLGATSGPLLEAIRPHWPRFPLGTDLLGRDLLIRCLTGGGISLGIGIAAAFISVVIGTFYGAISAYIGGKTDAVMMRIVDILYGLPYVLLVVLLAVAVDSVVEAKMTHRVEAAAARRETYIAQNTPLPTPDSTADEAAVAAVRDRAMARFGSGELSGTYLHLVNVVTLLTAIGGVIWLTMARVVRGQVLSLKAQPFMEAARALGVPPGRQFFRHLLPNLVGPIVVYATLTVPQAILQESFLSFLGIGVKPPLPSWGNLAAEGLSELNSYKSHWWLLLFPCLLLGSTLLALNFVGEGLREAFDPRRARR